MPPYTKSSPSPLHRLFRAHIECHFSFAFRRPLKGKYRFPSTFRPRTWQVLVLPPEKSSSSTAGGGAKHFLKRRRRARKVQKWPPHFAFSSTLQPPSSVKGVLSRRGRKHRRENRGSSSCAILDDGQLIPLCASAREKRPFLPPLFTMGDFE